MFKKISWFIGATTAVLGGLVFSGSSLAAETLVSFSNGEVITDQEFVGFVKARPALENFARTEWGLPKVVEEMALTRTLVLEGQQLGLEVAADRVLQRFDDVYALSVYSKVSATCRKPEGEEESRRFYNENPSAFRLPAQVRLARVMVPDSASVDGVPAAQWLPLQAQAIAAGAVDFLKVAEKASRTHEADKQGDLGWVLATDDSPLLRSIASAQAGDMVGPVQDGNFLYLFNILDKRESRQLSWAEVATQVPARAEQHCREQSRLKVVADLFGKLGVVQDAEAIKRFSQKPRGSQ